MYFIISNTENIAMNKLCGEKKWEFFFGTNFFAYSKTVRKIKIIMSLCGGRGSMFKLVNK